MIPDLLKNHRERNKHEFGKMQVLSQTLKNASVLKETGYSYWNTKTDKGRIF